MFDIELMGKKFKVFEHISEVKEHDSTRIFNRFYNRSQMFKYFLDKYVFVEDGVEYKENYKDVCEQCHIGQPCGQRVVCGKTDSSVTFYKDALLNIDKSSMLDIESYCKFGDSFFVQDKTGQIYFVEVHVD